MIFWTCSRELPIPSGPMLNFAGHAIFWSSTITGPGSSSLSTAWRMIRIDWRISSTRSRNREKQSASLLVGTSKSYSS